MIHYKQMDKADRDPSQALRAEDECRQLIVAVPEQQVRRREPSSCCAIFRKRWPKASIRSAISITSAARNSAAANRFSRLVDQYPLYSKADEALWELGDSYSAHGHPLPQGGRRRLRHAS